MHPTPVALQVLALRPNVSLHALLVAPRALVPVAGLRQLASAWFGGDASRALLERLQALADNPTATVEGGGGGNPAEPAGALEELLPLLVEARCRPAACNPVYPGCNRVLSSAATMCTLGCSRTPSSLHVSHVSQAWELEHGAHEQRLRSAFAAAQPASGVLTRDAFAALVRSLEGGAAAAAADPAIDAERVGAMYEAALDCSSGLPAGSKCPCSQLGTHAATHRPRSPAHLPRAAPWAREKSPRPCGRTAAAAAHRCLLPKSLMSPPLNLQACSSSPSRTSSSSRRLSTSAAPPDCEADGMRIERVHVRPRPAEPVAAAKQRW